MKSPSHPEDKKYVQKSYPRAECMSSEGWYQVVNPWKEEPSTSFLVQHLSSSMESEQEAWQSAAERLRRMESIRDQAPQNMELVKRVFGNAFCATTTGSRFQIRRFKRPEDSGVRKNVSLSGTFSEEALAWEDAAQRANRSLDRKRELSEEGKLDLGTQVLAS